MIRPTIRVRTEGGVEHDLDVPPDGTPARKELDALVRRGAYTVIEGRGVYDELRSAYTPVESEAPPAVQGDTSSSAADVTPEPEVERPAGNASQEVWAAWAVAHGGLDEATAGAMTRDELRSAYTPVESEPESGDGGGA